MPIPLPTLESDAYARFHCAGTECEDTCCKGMGVMIDKATYEKYQALPDSEIKAAIREHIEENALSVAPSTHARIRNVDGSCPFLTDQRLCRIQLTLGEAYLSRACTTYPRGYSRVDGVLERSLYLSCPEAVRTLLFAPAPMRFTRGMTEDDPRLVDFPTMDSAIDIGDGKPYAVFADVRDACIACLQDRRFDVWERVVLLGLLCERIDSLLADGRPDALPDALREFGEFLGSDNARQVLATVESQPQLKVAATVAAVEMRMRNAPVGERFLDCYAEFLRGLDHSDAQTINSSYNAAYSDDYAPYMSSRSHILEHYLVNQVFKGLFPFGPQSGLYHQPKSVAEEYALLALQFALLKTLLVGSAGYHKRYFGDTHVVKIIQSFSKEIEHNLPFLLQLYTALAENGMVGISYLAALVRD